MYVITQFFRTDRNTINHSIDKLNKLVVNGKITKAVVFSDIRVRGLDPKILLLHKQTRLKWSDLFKFIIDSNMNKQRVYVLEPNCFEIPVMNQSGFKLIPNGIYVKDLDKVYNINRFVFDDYHFLDANININKIKVASICHIYYEDLLEEMISKLKSLDHFETTYYFTLTAYNSTVGQKRWIKKRLKEEFTNCEILELPNRGLDIGAFFKVLEKIYNLNYDYIIKTHTKKSIKTSGSYFGNIWRKDLLDITDIEKIDDPLKSREIMIGSKKWIIPVEKDGLNDNMIANLKTELNIIKGHQFVGGTMFWLRFPTLKKYFSLDQIKKYYKELEEGYFFQVDKKNGEYLTHSFERIFGMIVGNEGKKIKGV